MLCNNKIYLWMQRCLVAEFILYRDLFYNIYFLLTALLISIGAQKNIWERDLVRWLPYIYQNNQEPISEKYCHEVEYKSNKS